MSHFLLHGAPEQRSPIPLFDSKYYLETYPDVRKSGFNPLVHFVSVGWREGRNPSPDFDCAAYRARYEDVRTSGLNPLVHYLEIGREQGRRAITVAETQLPAPPRVGLTSNSIRPRALTPATDRVPDARVPVSAVRGQCLPHPAHADGAADLRVSASCPVIVPLEWGRPG